MNLEDLIANGPSEDINRIIEVIDQLPLGASRFVAISLLGALTSAAEEESVVSFMNAIIPMAEELGKRHE